MSIEEVQAKADEILLAYAKDGKVDFSLNEEEESKAVGMKRFGNPSKKATSRGRYGGIFKK